MEVFVFGSNTSGRHGKGAALSAAKLYGAMYGYGEGFSGRSYAIPTRFFKGKSLSNRSLTQIRGSVRTFLIFAGLHPEMTFKVTRVGCGYAGKTDNEMAPMFYGAPDNCEFDPEWARFGLKSWTTPPQIFREQDHSHEAARRFA